MTKSSILDYLPLRCRPLNKRPVRKKGGDYVLCWLQQTLRSDNNPVIDAAILAGRNLGKPVLIYHGLSENYPYASDRLHNFILQASRSLEQGVTKRGIRFMRYVQRKSKAHPTLLYKLASRATSVIVDDVTTFVGRQNALNVAARLPIAVLAVDGLRLIPEAALGKPILSTPEFRSRTGPLREDWLAEPCNLVTGRALYAGTLPIEHDELMDELSIANSIKQCRIDHTLWPIKWCAGDRAQGLQHLELAVDHVLPHYASARNNAADATSVSRLSPLLHFGVLSAREITQAVIDADIESRHRWKFLDELLTWREYFHHQMANTAKPASYTVVPASGRKTLEEHRNDPREKIYDLNSLVLGQTDDETWNAAQKQFVLEGWMHNNLRMYWGKKIIGWTPSPEIAWSTACYLNDRFSLDGRDPATYGNLAWCFSAKYKRDQPVYGTVPPKSDRAMRRRPGVSEWLKELAGREVPESLMLPEELPNYYLPNS